MNLSTRRPLLCCSYFGTLFVATVMAVWIDVAALVGASVLCRCNSVDAHGFIGDVAATPDARHLVAIPAMARLWRQQP